MDGKNLRSLQGAQRALYPDIVMPASTSANLTSRQRTLIAKTRDLTYKLKNSAFYVRPTTEVPDIMRYEFRKDSNTSRFLPDASNVLANCLGGKKRTALGAFFPDELVKGQQKSRKAFRLKSKKENNEKDIEFDGDDGDDASNNDDGEENENLGNDDVEEEENQDYTKDYYQSSSEEENEDAEAVF